MKFCSVLAAALLVALPVEAFAAAKQCLTRDEAKGLGMFILPDTVVALRDKCKGAVPGKAYLNTADASDRFRPVAELRWPVARKAFAKFAGGDGVLKLIGDDASRKLLIGSITQGIAKDVKPKSCAGIDRMLAALAPLPPENMDMLLDSFFLLGLGTSPTGPGGGEFKICPEAGAAGTGQ